MSEPITPNRRPNPARILEQLALGVVASWLGDRGVLIDDSRTGEPDFRIEYHDGRRALGEATWHADRTIEQMWQETLKRERHQIVELRQGLGQWAVHLRRGAQIGSLYRELPAFIDTLIAAGCFRLEPEYLSPNDRLVIRARKLGIEYIDRSAEHPETAYAYFSMPSSGGVIVREPNLVVDWIESVLADPAFADVPRKVLAPLGFDERHVFVMSGSLTPFEVQEPLMHVGVDLPSRDPEIDAGLTHVWVASQWTSNEVVPAAGLWVRGSGWERVEFQISNSP